MGGEEERGVDDLIHRIPRGTDLLLCICLIQRTISSIFGFIDVHWPLGIVRNLSILDVALESSVCVVVGRDDDLYELVHWGVMGGRGTWTFH